MSNYLLHLSIMIISWLLMYIAYFGWGILIAKLLKIQIQSLEKIYVPLWLGWSASLFIMGIYNFFSPINVYSSLFIFSVGIIIALMYFNKYKYFIEKDQLLITDFIFITFLIIIAVVIASRSMLSPSIYDSGLYHFNSIRWLNEYPVVPGLGNLHGRLAFNQSFFIYVASLNLYPLFGHGHNLANSFLLMILFSELIKDSMVYIKNMHVLNNFLNINLVSLLLIPVLLFFMITAGLSSPTPDVASSLLQILLFIHFIRFIDSYDYSRLNISRVNFILLISAVLITIKLSNIVFAATVAFFTIILASRYLLNNTDWKLFAPILWSTGSIMLFMFVWVTRGVVTSGFPFYPSTIGRVYTDWAMPVEAAVSEAKWVYSWARKPGVHYDHVLGNWEWLRPWFNQFISGGIELIYFIITIISLLIIVVSIFLFIKNKRERPTKINLVAIFPIAVVTVSLIFWFFSAPDARYANALFLIFPIAAFVFFKAQLSEHTIRFIWKRRKKIFLLVLIAFFLVSSIIGLWFSKNTSHFRFIATKGFEPIKSVDLIELETKTGLKKWIPVEGDQCWDSPIPATPYFNPDLSLRGDLLKKGFTLIIE